MLDGPVVGQPFVEAGARLRNAVAIEVRTRVGNHYQLQQSLDIANWADAGAPLIGDGQTNRIWRLTDEAEGTFYCLQEAP